MKSANRLLIFLQIITTLFISSHGWAGDVVERFASIESARGSVQYQRQGSVDWTEAKVGDKLLQGDRIKATEGGKAELLFHGRSNTHVEIRPSSEVELASVGTVNASDDTELKLALGSVFVKAEKLKGESRFEVKTANSVVGIRGTEFEVFAN